MRAGFRGREMPNVLAINSKPAPPLNCSISAARLSELYLLPGRGRIVVLADEGVRQRVEFWFPFAVRSVVPAAELADVQEGDDEEVEGVQRLSSLTGNPRSQSVAYRLLTWTRTCGSFARPWGRWRGSGWMQIRS